MVAVLIHDTDLKGITHTGLYSYTDLASLNYESYQYALSRAMAQAALVFHRTSACTGRPFNG